MTKHLKSNKIDMIALCLDEDVYGVNSDLDGDLDDEQIMARLIANIHEATRFHYKDSNLLPVHTVANLIKHVWEYEDRKVINLFARIQGDSIMPKTTAIKMKEKEEEETQ